MIFQLRSSDPGEELWAARFKHSVLAPRFPPSWLVRRLPEEPRRISVAVWAGIRQPLAEAVVQRPEHRVLKTRHHDWKPWLPTENGFRELQSIDLLCGNDHHLKPLENGRLRDIHAVTG